MSFVVYDIIFMVVFTLLVVIFLYLRRRNLKRQGLLYLYHTKVGINFIESVNKRFSKILKPMQYLVVACGYALMAGIIWLVVRFAYVYLSSPSIARDLKVPVLVPLVPYLPDLFKITYLPPFYFTYWIIIIAIIAVPHEFAHGIFAKLNKIKIHSTGFGFLGPFLAAFVEPDEKKMAKSSKLAQLSVLAAGTFANVLTMIFFALIIWLFFLSAFNPIGVQFDTYSLGAVNVTDIRLIDGIPIENFQSEGVLLSSNNSLINLTTSQGNYFFPKNSFDNSVLKKEIVVAYEDSPALRAGLGGAIIKINGEKIDSKEKLKSVMLQKKPGDILYIKTKQQSGEIKEYNITLGEKNGKAFLGIGIEPIETQGLGLFGNLKLKFIEISDPRLYHKYFDNLVYESKLGELGIFIYYILWWATLVSFSVALMNMLPVGIFDGGRFFLLTIWGITRKKKIGELAFKISTWTILALVAAMMAKWFFAIF
jgi:membrane-associated protease RseP (regulator of RpoE activity)